MGKPKAPTPPSPQETSAAQTGTSVNTAIANTAMGNVDQYGPTGSLTYNQTGSTSLTDPYTGQTYNIPKYSATTSLTPEQQAIFDQNQGAQLGMATTANIAGQNLQSLLGQNFDPQGLPERGTVPVADDATRQRVESALFERMQPQIDQDRERLDTKLANQGIGMGARAYSAANDQFDRGVNDARLGAILGAGQEQSRLFGMGMDQFNAQNSLRGQSLSEAFAMRNQPINEITALLSGSQVSAPNFQMNTPSSIPTTDNAGLINQNYQQQFGNYQSRLGSWNDVVGGGLGAFGSFLGRPRA